MDTTVDRTARTLLVLVGALIGAGLGLLAFVVLPRGNLARLLGALLTLGAAVLGLRFAGDVARSVFAPYNVAKVTVEGPIVRRPGGSIPPRPVVFTADDIVDQIERATADENARALVVELNTPGGEVVPSDDIRKAVESFEGPTIAYATDTCASGGYWIASGCDHIVAREGSIVGSIGVIASRVTGEGLLDRLGLSYERLVAGEYKDAGSTLRSLDEDERAYLQGIVDDYYQTFVDRVESGRDLDEETIRETEARVFLGPEARERGLVDEIGTETAVDAWLEDQLGEPTTVEEFAPSVGLASRLRMGAERTAYALGAGLASVVAEDGSTSGLRFR